MKINVTQKDIESAAKNYGLRSCPIAKAVNRTLRIKTAVVTNTLVWIGCNSYSLPNEAKHFIEDFDDGHQVEPFTFILPKP